MKTQIFFGVFYCADLTPKLRLNWRSYWRQHAPTLALAPPPPRRRPTTNGAPVQQGCRRYSVYHQKWFLAGEPFSHAYRCYSRRTCGAGAESVNERFSEVALGLRRLIHRFSIDIGLTLSESHEKPAYF